MRAEFIGKYRNKDGTTNLFYKYHGHEYMITDYGWTEYRESLQDQHHNEQKRIDDIIEFEKETDVKKGNDTSIDDVILKFLEDCGD